MIKTNGRTCTNVLKAEQDLFPPIHILDQIKWPTEQEIKEVAKRLAAIRERGASFEAAGDYFNSGYLAYELREIIQTTAELFGKSNRGKR